MVSLTFFGGVSEIGGNKILLEDKKTRIFLDFGRSFTLLDGYFVPESYLLPRNRFGLRDYFAFGLVPKLPGLYSRWALERTDLPYSEADFDGIIISHAHYDHVAHLTYLNPDIPIHLGEACKRILDSAQETAGQNYFGSDNKFNLFRTGKNFTIGDLNIRPIHVDHSVPGAYGFIIETSEGNIAYSGDLRKHGPRADMTEDFLEQATKFDPCALIIEGTRVTGQEHRKNHTEHFVQAECRKVAEDTKGLMLAMRYPKDIDRFRSFYNLAKETGKTLVISLKTAHLLLALKNDPISLPDPYSDKNIRIYGREMKIYKPWEEPMLSKCIGADYMAEHQEECILELDFFQLTELIDIKPKGGACIHSMSEPFEEDPVTQVSEEVLKNWARAFNLSYHQLHASGHASMGEIFGFIERINAGKVMPVHTAHPEMFAQSNAEVLLPVKGNRIDL